MKKLISVGCLLGLFVGGAVSAGPMLISCQGRLFDGKQLMQGEVDLQLRVYFQPTGGEVIYEDRAKVKVVDGIYATYLGDDSVAGDLGKALAKGEAYLEVVANGIAFSPREKLGAEAYSIVASRVVDGAITADMMGPDSVESGHIADGAITPPKLAASYWSTSGNNAQADSAPVLGTLNAQAVEVAVNGKTALRLSPDGRVVFTAPGNVGINTDQPTEALTVDGNVAASGYVGDGSRLHGVIANQIVEGGVSDASVADNAGIAPEKIAGTALTQGSVFKGDVAGAANALKLQPGVVTAEHLAKGVIPEIPKIVDFKIEKGSITAEMLADGVIPVVPEIPKFEIKDGSITADKLAKGVIPEVPEFKIKKGSVTKEMLAKGVIPKMPRFELKKGSITADHLAKGVIPEIPKFEIKKGSITRDQLAFTPDPRAALTEKGDNIRFGASDNMFKKGTEGATVSGGGSAKQPHVASGKFVTIGGGLGNVVGQEYATVGGGFNNAATGSGATVAGGWRNQATELDASVGGGQDNIAGGFASTVSGGFNNQALGNQATIAGGLDNVAKGDLTFVTGRRAKANHSGVVMLTDAQDSDFVSTGDHQVLIRAAGNVGIDTTRPVEKLTVAGNVAPSESGRHNLGSRGLRWNQLYIGDSIDYEKLSFVHDGNKALTLGPNGSAELLGLRLLPASESPRIVGGHSGNHVDENAVGSVIAGGGNAESPNRISGQYAAIGGGFGNHASGFSATVSGGQDNKGVGTASVITGGYKNHADGLFTVVSGGVENRVSQKLGVVNGGFSNHVAAAFGVVSGGAFNEVTGEYGMAAGRRAKVKHSGSFVWADAVDADVETTSRNQFIARASGGVQFYSNSRQSTGVLLPSGSGSWAMLSDVNAKEDLTPVSSSTILKKLSDLPMYTWRYKGQEADVSHIGPTAQDFHQAFGVGEHETHISAIDADGVALSAIQALSKENAELRARLQQLESRFLNLVEALDANK